MKIITYYDDYRFHDACGMLEKTLRHWRPCHNLTVYRTLPAGCPTHSQSPYAFKPHLLDYERRQGTKLILWTDTSIRFMCPPGWIVDAIRTHGILLIEDSDQLMRCWISDRALSYFGLNRSDLGARNSLLAGVLGMDFRRDVANSFLDAWLAAEKAGMFVGDWDNTNRCVSEDASVKGHRHDQSCAGAIAVRIGIDCLSSTDMGVATWPCHSTACGRARIIIDRSCCCPAVSGMLASRTGRLKQHIRMSPSLLPPSSRSYYGY